MKLIVVFGSAAHSPAPGDIDVAYCDVAPDEVTTVVRAWAARRGMPPDLRIDAHEVGEFFGSIHLPIPLGMTGTAVNLVGEPTIRWIEYAHLPALVRAAGDDPAALQSALEGHGRLDLAGEPRGKDWEGYTQGLRALRSARAHAPAWEQAGPVAAELDALLAASDDDLAPLIEWVGATSPGGGANAIVSVGPDGLRQIHPRSGNSSQMAWSEVRRLLAPATAVAP